MRAVSAGKSRYTKAIGLLPVVVSFAAIAVLYIRGESFLWEPQYLVGISDTVFAAIVPAIVAFFAARAYLKTGSLNVLLMGCGMLGLGLCTATAGWLRPLPGGADYDVAIYNAGALVGSFCHFASAMLGASSRRQQYRPARRPILMIAYSAPLLFAVSFSLATLDHVVPPFFIQDVGPTALRQVVLGLAIFLYASSALIFMSSFLRTKSDFIYWYSLCLAIIALGLFASYIERIVGSPMGWVGRCSNYLGSIFALIAILVAVKSAKSGGLPLEEVIAGFFEDAEANYQSLVETASDAIISCDHDNRIILWNSAAGKMFGYSKAQTIGAPLFGMILPLNHENTLAEMIAASWGANPPKTIEIAGKHQNGHLFPIEISAFVRRVPSGQVTTCILRDITERKIADEALKESRATLQAALSSMTDAVIISDARGRFIEFNDAFATYYRFKDKDSCARTLSCYPDILDVFTADGLRPPLDQWAISRALRGERAANAEYILRSKETGETWVGSYSFGPIRDARGAIVGAVVSARDITENKQMEEQLRRSRDELETRVRERTEELLKTTRELREKAEIIDFAHDAVFLRDMDGKITFWNKGAFETYGFTAEEALGRLSHELLATELPAPVETIVAAILEKYEWEGEIVHTKADGQRIVVDSRWAMQAGKDGQPAGFLEINRDITARKVAEEEFRKADRAFRTLSEVNQALVRQTDELELLRKVCAIVADVGGYRLVWVGFARDDEQKTVEPIASAGYDAGYLTRARISWADNERGRGPCGVSIRTGKTTVSQNTESNPDFSPWRFEAIERGIASSISLPLIVDGKAIGALGIYASEPDAFDQAEAGLLGMLAENLSYGISSIRSDQKRRKSEEAVSAERKRLFDVFETLPPMISLMTQDHHVAFANRSFRQRFGESNGRLCYQYCFGRSEPCDFCQAYTVLRTGRPHHWELTTPEGEVIDRYDFPFTDVDGSLMILEMSIDITDRRRAEARLAATVSRLELANRELEDFAFVAAHDLQEPLRKIQTFTDMALKRCTSALDDTGRQYLDRVVNSASRMRQLLHDLLEFSRVAAKGDPFRRVDLAEAAREATDVFEASTKQNGSLIEIGDLPEIEADRTQMVQLFQNLIGNALKYSELPPHIKIHSETGQEGFCEIFVQDNGLGFEQKYAERIFKPFQRLHGRGEYQGAGMGLAVCRKIVERHGGTIRARSEPGAGSTFIIRIPLKQAKLENDIDV